MQFCVTYKSPYWFIQIKNSGAGQHFHYVREQDEKETMDDFGRIVKFFPIKNFKTQKEAYQWVDYNLEKEHSKELKFSKGIWQLFDPLVGNSSPKEDE
jgi:hypothetical protein